MLEFTVVHKYCGYTKKIQGHNVWEALKTNGLDVNVWKVEGVENV